MRRIWLLLLFSTVSCDTSPRDDWDAVKRRIRSEFPEVKRISPEELRRRLEEGAEKPVLLDVREEKEFAVSHLPGAVRVEPGAKTSEYLKDLEKDTPIVAYCAVGYRSSQLARRLREQGFENVANLEGSIFEWANKGYPVERDGQRVREVHPYDEEWGRLLDESLHAYEPGRE